MRERLYHFLETSRSFPALVVQFTIIILIVLSALGALLQLLFPAQLYLFYDVIHHYEIIVLGVFTVEFLLRLYAAPSLKEFFKKPVSWIDLLAIAPFYVGLENTVILRIFRLLRILRLADATRIERVASIFDFKNSILRVVSPLIAVFIFLKGFIWFLEERGIWYIADDFDTLFTIIGFALGVVLSQKIGRSYAKYLAVQNDIYILQGRLLSLQESLNASKKNSGNKLIYTWLEGFLKIYNGKRTGAVTAMRAHNRDLHAAALKLGNAELIPFHRLSTLMERVFELSISIQSRRTSQTPIAYNVLLQQTTIMYLLLLVLFIPGMKGMISVVFAGYLLYGMFQITNDFDDVTGAHDKTGSSNLITMDAQRMRNYLAELKKLNRAKKA